jgi:hypothetical protein
MMTRTIKKSIRRRRNIHSKKRRTQREDGGLTHNESLPQSLIKRNRKRGKLKL